LCVDAFVEDEIVPKNLESNQVGLNLMTQFLEELKVDPQLMVMKKSWVIEKMLRTALAARKPKAELRRLYTLWQECATETLQKISDDKELEEVCALKWASAMKKHDKSFPSLIDSLGR
jgi:GTPase SAR1 family protein